MSSDQLHSNLTDLQLKKKGNYLFLVRKYQDAIHCYTGAIIKNPYNATYFTNRALCHLKLKQWHLCCQDCQRALDIDAKLLKAHFYLGESLIELEMYSPAIKHLQKAFELSKEQKQNFGNEITTLLLIARNKRCNLLQEQRSCEEIELKNYLSRLIKEDKERRLQKHTANKAANEDILEKRRNIYKEYDNHMKVLNNIFAIVNERWRNRDVPSYLCGKISLEILIDPVVTPSGITYERKCIEEHLQRVGNFDPLTRVKLTKDQLIPNFSIKEAVDAYITENEWILDY